MEFLAGNRFVQALEMRENGANIEARFAPEAFKALIDASFGGDETVESRTGGLHQRLSVNEITLEGSASVIRFSRLGSPRRLN